METVEELDARLERDMPMYGEAKRIQAKMMLAGDDGSWAGELDPVRVMISATAILAKELDALQKSANKSVT